MKLAAAALLASLASAAPAQAAVDGTWQLPLAALTDGYVTVAAVNEAAVPDGPKRRFLARTAASSGIPADLLAGVYWVCSDEGREARDPFCRDMRRRLWLPWHSYRQPARSRGFKADAAAVARTLSRLHRMLY